MMYDVVCQVHAGFFPAPDKQMKWYDGTYVQYSNWQHGRPTVNDTFMAGLSLSGKWILISDKKSFPDFKQMAIVTCKLDNGRSGFKPVGVTCVYCSRH